MSESVARRPAASRRGRSLAALCAPAFVALASLPPAFAQGITTTYTFENATDAANWTLDKQWSIAALPAGGKGLMGSGSGFARLSSAAVSGDVSSLKLRFRLGGVQAQLHANLYESGFTSGMFRRYFVRVATGGISLNLQTGSDCSTYCKSLGLADYAVAPNLFHDLEILIGHHSLDVLVDGDPVVGVDLSGSQVLPGGTVSVEPAAGTVYVDEVSVTTGATGPHLQAPRPPLSVPAGPDITLNGKTIFKAGVASSDISLTNQSLTLPPGRYTMENGKLIELHNSALRINKGVVLVFDRGSSALFHTGVDLTGNSLLEIVGGTIIPDGGALVRVMAFDNSLVVVEHARPAIHFINAGSTATVKIRNARFVTGIGGGVMLGDSATLEASNSRLGSIALAIPSGAYLKASQLPPTGPMIVSLQLDPAAGVLNATTATSPPIVTTGSTMNLKYSLSFNQVILEPDVLGDGPFERGWVFPVGEKGTLELGSSSVRKIWVELNSSVPKFQISNLRLGTPTTATVGGAHLKNVTVTGQWGFTMCPISASTCSTTSPCAISQVTFDKSDGLWLWPYQKVNVLVRDSSMNEFDPRRYEGTLTFERGRWEGGSEIIDDKGCGNAFRIEGTYAMDTYAGNRGSLSWKSSAVTRAFPVLVRDTNGKAVAGATVTVTTPSGKTLKAAANAEGLATIELKFDDTTYSFDRKWVVKADNGAAARIDFFSNTPVILQAK